MWGSARALALALLSCGSTGWWAEAADAAETVATTARKTLRDGSTMPVLGLGTWKSPKGEVEAAVRHALCEAGYLHIDTAQIYQNQEEVGKGINYALASCGLKREDLWVTSKIWMVDFHPKDVPAAVDRILRELGLSYVDQLLLHWPIPYKKPPVECPPSCSAEFAGTDDPQRPRDADGKMVTSSLDLRQTWRALHQIKKTGQVRSLGVSNFNATEVTLLMEGADASEAPAVNQVEAHVFWNQRELRQAMQKWDIALVAYSPLGNPGVYKDKLQGMSSLLVEEVAESSGLTPAQLMLSFLTTLGDVVIPKSVTPARIASNANFPLKLPEAAMKRLLSEAPQIRMANPKIRDGYLPVFEDAIPQSSGATGKAKGEL